MQADLRTISVCGYFVTTALTAVVDENTIEFTTVLSVNVVFV